MKARETRVFVDSMEDEWARVVLGEKAFDVPVALLPRGVREGTWVKLAAAPAPAPPDHARALRRKLSRGDPGGDVKL